MFNTMKPGPFQILACICIAGLMSGCSISSHSMKYPNYHIEFYKADFEYSGQVTAEATAVRILGIDWQRLFNWETGELSYDRAVDDAPGIALSGDVVSDQVIGAFSTVVPVLGNLGKGKVSSYALYNLMRDHPGYDVVIYPQYETTRFVFPVFYSKTTVKVTARLGKIK